MKSSTFAMIISEAKNLFYLNKHHLFLWEKMAKHLNFTPANVCQAPLITVCYTVISKNKCILPLLQVAQNIEIWKAHEQNCVTLPVLFRGISNVCLLASKSSLEMLFWMKCWSKVLEERCYIVKWICIPTISQ